ncbi:MAG: hypothetical protein WEB58_14715, partial [Planctomycetaceae bacterium]
KPTGTPSPPDYRNRRLHPKPWLESLRQFNVRGLQKVKAVLLWYALAHNLVRRMALQGEPMVIRK